MDGLRLFVSGLLGLFGSCLYSDIYWCFRCDVMMTCWDMCPLHDCIRYLCSNERFCLTLFLFLCVLEICCDITCSNAVDVPCVYVMKYVNGSIRIPFGWFHRRSIVEKGCHTFTCWPTHIEMRVQVGPVSQLSTI